MTFSVLLSPVSPESAAPLPSPCPHFQGLSLSLFAGVPPLAAVSASISTDRRKAGLAASHSRTLSMCPSVCRDKRMNKTQPCSERGHSPIAEIRKAHSGRKKKIS